ncbi:MAG: hypothetical protein SH817_16315 [Leptospira sp.]|nr:hypothetical protein [Leptospira sp.]
MKKVLFRQIKVLLSIYFLFLFGLDADEKSELSEISSYIRRVNKNYSSSKLITTAEDQWVYSVNYYINDENFKRILKQPDRDDSIRKWGNKRKWLVTKNLGVGESLYLFHSFQDVDDSWQFTPETKVKNIQDIHNFAFKNYCEENEKVNEDFARIKKLRITIFEAQYRVVNNLMNYEVANQFKKTKSYDISFPNEPKIVYPMPAYAPVGSKENVPGTIFVMKLTVLEVYPGKEGQPLCAEDFYLGYKNRGEYTEVLKQIDKI